MKTKTSTIIITILSALVLVWVYGYTTAANQYKDGKLSLFSATITALDLNPISAHAYKLYVKNVLTERQEAEAIKQAQIENEQLKAQYSEKVQAVAKVCIDSIENSLNSGSVFVKSPAGDGNKVHFTLNMYRLKKVMNFTCEFEGNAITSIDGTTVRTY